MSSGEIPTPFDPTPITGARSGASKEISPNWFQMTVRERAHSRRRLALFLEDPSVGPETDFAAPDFFSEMT